MDEQLGLPAGGIWGTEQGAAWYSVIGASPLAVELGVLYDKDGGVWVGDGLAGTVRCSLHGVGGFGVSWRQSL